MEGLAKFIRNLGWEAHDELEFSSGEPDDLDDESFDDVYVQVFSFEQYDATITESTVSGTSLQISNEETGERLFEAEATPANVDKFKAMLRKLTSG